MSSLVPVSRSTRLRKILRQTVSSPRFLIAAMVVVTALMALYVPVGSKEGRPSLPSVEQPVSGNKTPRPLKVDFSNNAQSVQSASPRALATGDFNLDGAPDLVTGFDTGSGGLLTLQLGNIDAYAPSSPAVYSAIHQGRIPDSFVSTGQTLSIPGAADFLVARDFNGDGTHDILVGTLGQNLYLLKGNGDSGFSDPHQISLPGVITAMAAAKVNRSAGEPDVAVAINGANGAEVLVFSDNKGGVLGEPTVSQLSAPATALVVDGLDSDPWHDVAALTGNRVEIVHGRGQAQQRSKADGDSVQAPVEVVSLPSQAQSLTVGDFVWDRRHVRELAVMTSDGSVHILQRAGIDQTPYSGEESAKQAWAREHGAVNNSPVSESRWSAWKPESTSQMLDAGKIPSVTGSSTSRIFTSYFGKHSTDDLIVPDVVQNRLSIVRRPGGQLVNSKTRESAITNGMDQPENLQLGVEADTIAILELPRKVNGNREMLVLKEGSSQAIIVPLEIATPVTVDTTADDGTKVACTAAPDDCSLRGAIVTFATIGANQPTTINVPAGTYILTNGRINVNGDGTSVVGVGAATTIIDQQSAAADNRIFFVNSGSAITGLEVSFSGITLTGAVNTTQGGGAILAGGPDHVTTFTNCTFSANQCNSAVAGNGGAIALATFANDDGGDLIINTSTFTNNSTASGVGGAVSFNAGPLGVDTAPVATPVATITGCIFDNNQATTNDGGAMNLTSAGTFGVYTVTKNTFTNNRALGAGDGGAINKGNGVLNANFNRFYRNSANSGGSGASAVRTSGNNNVNLTNNWWSCNGSPFEDDAPVVINPAAGCDDVQEATVAAGFTFTLNPRLQLTQTASPAEICLNSMTTLTASFLVNSDGGAVSTSNLYVLTGVAQAGPPALPTRTPIGLLFDNPVLGSLSLQDTFVESTGTATAVFTSGSTGGNGSARVTVDNAQVTTTIPIAQPIITGQTISRQQGSPVLNSSIATASNTITAPAHVASVNGGTSATVNGVTVSNVVVTGGTVTADVIASCTATNATFTLTMVDRLGCASPPSTLTVNVTPDTVPTLGVYPATGPVAQNSNFTVTPNAAPTDNGSVVSVTASAPLFTGTFSGNPTTGVISVSNANPSGTYTVTVTATDNCGLTTQTTFQLIVNTPPDIVGVADLTRQQGTAVSNSQIATVSDINQAANTLVVTVNGGATATVNGVTVSGIAVDAAGNVTANVVADCTATNATFTLTVTDSLGATDTVGLNVNVTPNSVPVLGTYPNTGPVAQNSTFMVTPSAAPTDNGTVTTLTASAPGFTGTFTGNATTGVISVANANPSGTYTVTVTATDNCGATNTATFQLIVNTPPDITGVAALTRQQGSAASSSQIATVSDVDQAANTLVVTVDGGASATVNGVTVSNIIIDGAGIVSADVVASCTATNAAFTLTVTDLIGATDTVGLTVNVTANTPPTLGTYPNTGPVVEGGGATVTPNAAPTDNGTVATLTASAPLFTGNFSGDPNTGVITITNANPAGNYVVTVTATDNCGATNTTTFNLLVQSCVAPPQVANLKAWWTGDNTPGDVAGGHDGTLQGDATYAAGKVAQAFSLDGTGDFVQAADAANWDVGNTDFTIDLWANFDTVNTSNALVAHDDGTGSANKWVFWVNNGNLEFHTNDTGGNAVNVGVPFVPTPATWYHLAVKRVGNDYTFYINGVPSAPITNATAVPDASAVLTIGSAEGGSFVDGLIDEVEIFNVGLSDAEVLSLFTADTAGKCKPFDLRITKADTTDPFDQGSTGSYTITVHNDGPASTSGTVTVSDNLPTGLSYNSFTGTGWSCDGSAPPLVTCTSSQGVSAASDYNVLTITVNVAANVATAVNNTATVSLTGELDTSDNSDTESTTLRPVADLGITKTDGATDEVPGTPVTYTITVSNAGPSDVTGVTVSDVFPGTISGVNFTSVSAGGATGNTAAGSGNIADTVNMPSGSSITYTATGNIASSASGSLANTATVTAPAGVLDAGGNNSATDTDNLITTADLSITKTDGATDEIPGSTVTYTITVSNSGPSDVTGASVADTFPAEITGVTFSSVSAGGATGNTAAGTGNISDTVNLPSGSSITYTATGTISSSATGSLSNTATVTAPGGVTDAAGNNSATDTDTLVPTADLSITKTDGATDEIPGSTVTYTITVTNSGPSDVTGATVADTFPATITGVNYTSVTSGGATGNTAAGAGNISDTVNMPSGSTITYTATGTISASATGSLSNTATVTAPGGVTDAAGNNSATDTDNLVVTGDLSITKTDGATDEVPGTPVTYTITVSNSGPSNITGATVADTFPATITGVSYTSSSAGGATGNTAAGAGNISDTLNLPSGSSVTYTATGTILASATGSLSNTATVTAPGGVTDAAGNNSATDTDTLTGSADLSVTKTDSPDPVIAGSNITYTINLTNSGPSDAQTVAVTDAVPANTTFVSASVMTGTGWTPASPVVGGTGNVSFSKGTVAAGETASFLMVVKVNSNVSAGTIITNTATASSATGDPDTTDDADTETTTVITSADLLVVKIDSPDPVAAGQNLTYTITVTNGGFSDAQSVSLSDTLPGFTSLVSFTVPGSWTRTDAVPPGGTGTVTATTPTLASGASAVFTLVVLVDAATPHNTVISNTATGSTATTDPDPSNNSSTVSTTVVSQPDMTVTKTHAGNFVAGQVGATYTITVKNDGTGPTNGSTVTLTDNVPVGLTPTAPNGAHNGWTCSIVGQLLTCTRNDVLAGNSSYPPITLTVNVANPAPLTVTNTATVSGGGELNTTNNSASDVTNIDCTQDFSQNNTSPLVISRFRENGPGGVTDEFVEIFNPTNSAHTVASGSCTGGYGIFASAGNGTTSNNVSLVCQIPNGTVIPARGYYLCTGAGYTLGNLGRNGGSSTAEGDTAMTVDIPNDAGLALINVGTNIVVNTAAGFAGASLPGAAVIVYDKVGFAPYGAGAPASAYPSLASNFCEGTCLQPVGDASNLPGCTNPSGLFPVVSAPPACYGQSGQYELLRRQTIFNGSTGTLHQDTNSNTADVLMVSPNPSINVGLNLSGVAGIKPVLGSASPHDSTAPGDFQTTVLSRTPFDVGSQTGPRNAERLYSLDPNVADMNNNPLGTYALRFKYTNNSGAAITGLRFSIDDLSTLCGPQTATPDTGTADGRNLSSTPNCQAGGTYTAILKGLNSATEVIVDSTLTAQTVNGLVMEDTTVAGSPVPAPGPRSPLGGGIDNSLVVNPSTSSASLGDGVNGGTGVFATGIGSGSSLRVKVKFGVVRSGRFIILVVPMGK